MAAAAADDGDTSRVRGAVGLDGGGCGWVREKS